MSNITSIEINGKNIRNFNIPHEFENVNISYSNSTTSKQTLYTAPYDCLVYATGRSRSTGICWLVLNNSTTGLRDERFSNNMEFNFTAKIWAKKGDSILIDSANISSGFVFRLYKV